IILGGTGANRTIKLVPAPDQFGKTIISVTVTDTGLDGIAGNGDDGSTTTSFELVVQPVNDAPLVDQHVDVTVSEDFITTDVTITGIAAGPPNESDQKISVVAISDHPEIVGNPKVTYTSP